MKKHKYKNRRFYCCETCGRRYNLIMLVPSDGCCKESLLWGSEKEYARWCELKLMEKNKIIDRLIRQRRFGFYLTYERDLSIYDKDEGHEWLEVVTYVADFTYYEKGVFVVEDTKGYRTKEYKKKKKLMEKVYGIVIKES